MVVRVSIFRSCCSCAKDFLTSSGMVCSPSQTSFPSPINVRLERFTIKPEVRGVKQLDNGIDDTFVSSVREEVSFALIDFQD
jgi:hypothetical protein